MWIDVLRTGTWTAGNGTKVDFTVADLDAIRDGYDPKNRKAPLVFGHPKENGPAFGWAKELRRTGEKLQARFEQVSDAVKDVVRKGYYKKVSLSLFPDKKTLRHVGLLGATQPAVPGLGDVAFVGSNDGLVFEFATQNNPTKEEPMEKVTELELALKAEKEKREAAETSLSQAETKAAAAEKKAKDAETRLSAGEKAARDKEIGERIDKLVGKQILPKDKPAVNAIAMSLADDALEIELASGAGKKRTVDHLFDFLAGLPDRQLLDEFSAPAGDEKAEDLGDITSKV